MVVKEEILSKLRQVIDPELGMNIVDIGLIYAVDIGPKPESADEQKTEPKNGVKNESKEKSQVAKLNQKIMIKMTFTTPACPMINEMLQEIQSKLEELPDLDIEISVVFDPPWNPEMMTEKAKIGLGII